MRFLPLVFPFLWIAATAEAGSNVKALRKQFRLLDLDRNASLSEGEFAKWLPAKLTKNNALADTQLEMFAWFDQDASEGIDCDEWIEGRKASNAVPAPYFSEEIQDELDANGDGKLTWKEFSRVMNSYVPAKTSRTWFDAMTSHSFSGSSLSLGVSSSSPVTSISGGSLSIAASNTYTGSAWVQDGSLSILSFGSLDNSGQTPSYLLIDPASNPAAPSVDGGSDPVSE